MSNLNKEVFNTSATFFKGSEAIDGNLVISSTGLIFNPSKVSDEIDTFSINMRDIKKVEKRNRLLLIADGVKLVLKNKEEYNFAVNNRIKIIDYLKSQI